jgi:hypothetical protein
MPLLSSRPPPSPLCMCGALALPCIPRRGTCPKVAPSQGAREGMKVGNRGRRKGNGPGRNRCEMPLPPLPSFLPVGIASPRVVGAGIYLPKAVPPLLFIPAKDGRKVGRCRRKAGL